MQDGGLVGLVFNVIPLVLLGTVAEHLWCGRRLLALFFGAGILGQFVGFAWQPRGAGNSVGDSGIATGLAVLCLLRARTLPPRLLGGAGIVAGLLLLPQRDIHGGACLIGTPLVTPLLILSGPRPASSERTT